MAGPFQHSGTRFKRCSHLPSRFRDALMGKASPLLTNMNVQHTEGLPEKEYNAPSLTGLRKLSY